MTTQSTRLPAAAGTMLAMLLAAGCRHDGDESEDTPPPPPPPPPPAVTYSVGGSVSGLVGSGLVLRNNGGNDLSASANGSFTFSTQLNSGSSYAVTVGTQPSSPAQTCVVSNGAGTIAAANVTNVTVTCTTNTFTLSGSVSGLNGTGLVLQNNGGDDLNIASNGSFAFATAINAGGSYVVTVRTQPSGPIQQCAIANGSGANVNANITNVMVTCVPASFTVGGAVSGLNGTGLVLQNNGDDDLGLATNGSFVFNTAINSGGGYAVTVRTQPAAPIQHCTVTNGSGSGVTANVTNVAVACGDVTPRFIYTMDYATGTLSTFRVDAQTGALRHFDLAKTGTQPIGFRAVTSPVNSDLGFAYSLNSGSQDITGRTFNRRTGVGGGAIPGLPLALPSAPSSFNSHPNNRFVYVTHPTANNIATYAIDSTTGALTAVGGAVATGDSPQSLVFGPDARFAYVTNTGSNDIYVYEVNDTSGAITEIPANRVSTGAQPRALTFLSSGAFAYLLSAQSDTIAGYAVNATTGALTPVAGSPYATDANPSALLVHPNGRFIYVANSGSDNVSAFAIDSSTGALTALGGNPFPAAVQPTALAFDASGRFMYVTHTNAAAPGITGFRVDAMTGIPLAIGPLTQTPPSPRMTLEPSGKYLYAASNTNSNVASFRIDQTTGALSLLDSMYLINTGGAPIFSFSALSSTTPATVVPKHVFVANDGDGGNGNVATYAVNATTGSLTAVGTPIATGISPASLTTRPDGRYVYVANADSNSISAYANDNGALTPVVGSPFGTAGAPNVVAAAAGGRFVYSIQSDNVVTHAINQATGALTDVQTIAAGVAPQSVAISHTNRCLFAANNGSNNLHAFAVNPVSGGLTNVTGSPYAVGDLPNEVIVHPSGRFVYVVNDGDNTVSAFLINTSAATPCALAALPGSPYSAGPAAFGLISIAAEPSGRYVYAVNEASDSVSIFSVNQSTGALTLQGVPVVVGTSADAVYTEPSGRFLYVSRQSTGSQELATYTIDATTGAITPVSDAVLAIPNANDSVIAGGLEF